MKNKIIDYISNNYNELKEITHKITLNSIYTEDLLQEVILQILEKDLITLDDDKNIKYYIIGLIKINWYSTTSPFYYKIKREFDKYAELTIDICDENMYDEQYEKLLTEMEKQMGELDWFKKEILSHYMVLGSLRKVNQLTKIPIPSISRYVKEAKETLKENINKNNI